MVTSVPAFPRSRLLPASRVRRAPRTRGCRATESALSAHLMSRRHPQTDACGGAAGSVAGTGGPVAGTGGPVAGTGGPVAGTGGPVAGTGGRGD